ncbi:MAG: sulfatase [Planctomycetes bacterium]|nr:sulfatase [Planctomycetota bacterium]
MLDRRSFLKRAAGGAASIALSCRSAGGTRADAGAGGARRPNLVYVFADQWRAQATGYAGDPNARTPNIDRLAGESIRFATAVSSCPVCSPYRASLMTGRYPLTHGVFMNDVCLGTEAVSFAQALDAAGYDTGYIGKWHLDGHGRSAFIPRERRQGFRFWKARECTHDYNRSFYYGDTDEKLFWDGYDSIAQTREASRYIREHAGGKPFALFLSWGPPHDPYPTAPAEYRAFFAPEKIALRQNVPAEKAAEARKMLAGYYAHCAALDACVGAIVETLRACRIEDETILVFTSDHGDLLGSHGQRNKQQPWDESILVPFLLRYPAVLGRATRILHTPFVSPDILPTILGLAGVDIPATVEGNDISPILRGADPPPDGAALILCAQPFGQWPRARGGKEYRGIRTRRHTYVRDLEKPWLLFDNAKDPCQLENLAGKPEHAALEARLDLALERRLRERGDEFLPGEAYLKRWGYEVDATGTIPYAS